ncbi:MAG: RAMP superfamily CRISPR-associated protein [Propioniciclava sp.]
MTKQRTLLRVDIRIDQHWAIGAAPDVAFRPDAPDIDYQDRTIRLPIQRDASGRVALPATSLVGCLRNHLGAAGDRWLGTSTSSGTQPSALRTLAATVHTPDPIQERTTTAVDGDRRAAAAGSLRREELVPPSLVTWWIEWDHRDESLKFADLLARLATWHPVVGRRRSANRGRAHVQQIHDRTIDLTTVEGLTWWLTDRHTLDWSSADCPPGEEWRRTDGGSADPGTRLATYTFGVVDGLHIGGAGHTDNLIHTATTLPSTSWRGVFRHRAEHILRVASPNPDAENHATETIDRLFGTGRTKAASETGGRRGILRFAGSEISAEPSTRTHVAIDRVSGGAAQGTVQDPRDSSGMLFSVQYFPPETTVALTIFVDGHEQLSAEDRHLIDQIIRDINDGVIGVGGMTSRGYGTLTLVREDR